MSDIFQSVSPIQWYLVLGIVISVVGIVRLLLVRDLVARLIALNIVGAGSLLILITLAARSAPIDPVLSALVLTGLVITVAFTGVAAVLIRRIEATSDGYLAAQGDSAGPPTMTSTTPPAQEKGEPA